MTEQDKQRIEKDAQEWSDTADLYYDENGFETSYIAGATAEHERMAELLKQERNKVIDECIAIFKDEFSLTEDVESEDWALTKRLEALKGKSQ